MADKRNKDIAELYRLVSNLYFLHYPEQQNFKTRDGLFRAIVDYDVIFPNGVEDMLAYIEFATNEFKEGDSIQILATCMHDINGRKEEYLLPRTSGYAYRKAY